MYILQTILRPAFTGLWIFLLSLPAPARSNKHFDAKSALTDLCPQLRHLVDETALARTQADNQRAHRWFPTTLRKDGNLQLGNAHDWRAGFYPGIMWMMYAETGDAQWRAEAEASTQALEAATRFTGTHDLGFMIYNSYGLGLEIMGESNSDALSSVYREAVLRAAQTLAGRFNEQVGCTRSWDFNRELWTFPVIIDNMMNLELFFRATQLSGDSVFWKMATNHADRTLREHFRGDGSSYHVVDYDPATGAVRSRVTKQGFADDSFWARGQAWGLYGFTMCYRFTHDVRYLACAQRIAAFWLGWKHLPSDHIPYWDMKLPHYDSSTPRDASAAAIAASAFLELSQYVPRKTARRYVREAETILRSLTSAPYRVETGAERGFLLRHSTGHLPGNSEVDVPLIYADYYYVEALRRFDAIMSGKAQFGPK